MVYSNYDVWYFQNEPPEVEVGSMADRVWIARAEQLILILALVLTNIIVLAAVVVGKSTTMFMISQERTNKLDDNDEIF
jgi:hypothetical protein